jgi:hypothetical protein
VCILSVIVTITLLTILIFHQGFVGVARSHPSNVFRQAHLINSLIRSSLIPKINYHITPLTKMLFFKLSIALAPLAVLAVPAQVQSASQGKPQSLITTTGQSVPHPPMTQTDLPLSASHHRRQTPVGGVLQTVAAIPDPNANGGPDIVSADGYSTVQATTPVQGPTPQEPTPTTTTNPICSVINGALGCPFQN